MTASEATAALQSQFGSQVLSTNEFRGEQTLVVDTASAKAILGYCKDELDFDYLLDISSVDNFGTDPRFEMVYELYSMSNASHLRIKCTVSEDDLEVDTVSDLWPTADWHEREVYDMMGILFRGHPDMRRILMWEGFPFFPLRKDFPLAGRESEMPEVAFSDKAPLAGGPFVTSPSDASTVHREPRARDQK